MDATDNWRIRVPVERLDALRDDPAFRQVLALGRFLNSLRFCQYSMIEWSGLDTPAGQRQRTAAFFIAAGLLHEGLQLIERMGKHFRHYPSWAGKIQLVLADRAVEQLQSERFIPLRDSTVFHFGEDAFVEPLARFDQDTVVLVSGVGPQQGEVAYEFSDLLAFHVFLGYPDDPPDDRLKRPRELMERTVELMARLGTAGEALINDYCTANRFVAEQRAPDGSWRAA